jgi:hypothetical protein
MAKLRYFGDTIYRGADQFLNRSLTVAPGHIAEVSDEKAAELMVSGEWTAFESPAALPVVSVVTLSADAGESSAGNEALDF